MKGFNYLATLPLKTKNNFEGQRHKKCFFKGYTQFAATLHARQKFGQSTHRFLTHHQFFPFRQRTRLGTRSPSNSSGVLSYHQLLATSQKGSTRPYRLKIDRNSQAQSYGRLPINMRAGANQCASVFFCTESYLTPRIAYLVKPCNYSWDQRSTS